MTRIVILDYSSGVATIKILPSHLIDAQIEQVEEWLTEQGWRIKDISWMTTNQEIES